MSKAEQIALIKKAIVLLDVCAGEISATVAELNAISDGNFSEAEFDLFGESIAAVGTALRSTAYRFLAVNGRYKGNVVVENVTVIRDGKPT